MSRAEYITRTLKGPSGRRAVSIEDEYAEDSDLSDCDDDDNDVEAVRPSYCYTEDPVARWQSHASKPAGRNLLEAGKSPYIECTPQFPDV